MFLIGLLALSLAACFEPAERGPYLQNASSTLIVIKWRDSDTNISRISYGTRPGALNHVAESITDTADHEILLDKLIPNTVYYYRAKCTAG